VHRTGIATGGLIERLQGGTIKEMKNTLAQTAGIAIMNVSAHAARSDNLTKVSESNNLNPQKPFATQMFEPGANCTPWPLSVPGFRLNCAFIAPPRPGEDREAWVQALRDYRQALRTGNDDFGLRLHPGSFDRRNFHSPPPFDADMTMLAPVAEAYDFRPGEKVRVVVQARLSEGEGVLRVWGTEQPLTMPLNQWQTLEFDAVVPAAGESSEALLTVTFGGTEKCKLPQLDIRSMVFLVGDEGRMARALAVGRSTIGRLEDYPRPIGLMPLVLGPQHLKS